MIERKTFKLSGLECADCAQTIIKALKKLKGIENIDLSFETSRCVVEFKPNIISTAEIVREIVRLGYRANVEDFKTKKQTQTAIGFIFEKKEPIILVISLLLILAAFYFDFFAKNEFVSNILYLVIFLIIGVPILLKGIKAIIYARAIDTNLLMGIAGIGGIAINQYEEAAILVFLYSLGTYIQKYTFEKARKSLSSLIDSMSKEFRVQRNTEEIIVQLEDVRVGDIVFFREGELVPFDCEILEESCTVDESGLTGEFKTFEKKQGDLINAGSYIRSGFVKVKIISAYRDTTIAKIVHLVEEAQERKAKTQQIVDKFAAIYTPVVICIAVIVGLVIPIVFGLNIKDSLAQGLTFLVISCPCAFVISVPVCIISAIHNLSKNGVIVKGGAYLESVASTDTIFFDKTGTITEGKYSVVHIYPFSDISESEIIRIASSLEQSSNHPIAQALKEHATKLNEKTFNVSSPEVISSSGVKGIVADRKYILGNKRFMADMGLNLTTKSLNEECNTLHTTIYLATNGTLLGSICLVDEIRSEACEALKDLKEMGIENIKIFSGDRSEIVKKITSDLGVLEYRGEMKPFEKAKWIEDEIKAGRNVLAVGDGINDAAALSKASVGVALVSKGQDITVDSADVVLIGNDISKIPLLISVGKKAVSIIKQNIFCSLFVKFVFFALNSIMYVNMWMAVASDMGVSLLVTLNGLRLLSKSKVHSHKDNGN